MTALWIWLAGAVCLPIVGQRIQHRFHHRTAGPLHPFPLVLFLSCLLLWVLLAWEVSGAHGQSPRPFWFGSVCALGLIWVETFLVLLPGRRRFHENEPQEALPTTRPESERHEIDNESFEEDPLELSPEAESLWRRISHFETMQVHSIMTPGASIRTIAADATAAEALAQMRESGRTRLVAIEGSLERIVGIAHAKDLAPLLLTGQEQETIRHHHRRLRRVPERLTLTRLIEQFRRDRTTAGVVIDLRGKTLGLVTLGDVFHYVSGREGPFS